MITVHRDRVTLVTPNGARPPGPRCCLQWETGSPSYRRPDQPDPLSGTWPHLPRWSTLQRVDPVSTGQDVDVVQVLAANVDQVFLTHPLDRPVSLGRIERSWSRYGTPAPPRWWSSPRRTPQPSLESWSRGAPTGRRRRHCGHVVGHRRRAGLAGRSGPTRTARSCSSAHRGQARPRWSMRSLGGPRRWGRCAGRTTGAGIPPRSATCCRCRGVGC